MLCKAMPFYMQHGGYIEATCIISAFKLEKEDKALKHGSNIYSCVMILYNVRHTIPEAL